MMRPFQNFVQHKMAEPFDWANNVIYITARPPPKLVFWSRIVVIQGDFPLKASGRSLPMRLPAGENHLIGSISVFLKGRRQFNPSAQATFQAFPLPGVRWRSHGADAKYPRSRRIEL
jgi:hypothetical protein